MSNVYVYDGSKTTTSNSLYGQDRYTDISKLCAGAQVARILQELRRFSVQSNQSKLICNSR